MFTFATLSRKSSLNIKKSIFVIFLLDFGKYFSNIIAVIAKSDKFSYYTESHHQMMDMLFIH